jgi:hypothetical protein
MSQRSKWMLCLGMAAVLGACGSGSGRRTGGDPREGAGAACSSTTECASGQACVVVAGIGACALSCSVSGNECSGQASCGPVGSISANYCQQPPPSGVPSEDSPPQADEQPSIPCVSDAECAAIEAGAVCATFEGERECTIRCSARSQCNPPSFGGITTDFFTCIPDEGDRSRTVCLPDVACFSTSDPLRCVTIDTPTVPTDPIDPTDPMNPDFPDFPEE